MLFFSCFRGEALRPDPSRCTVPKDGNVGQASRGQEPIQGALEAIEAIQAALLGASRTWLGRLQALSHSFVEHGLIAEVYGIREVGGCDVAEFVPLSASALGEGVVKERTDVLQRVLTTKAPLAIQLQSHPSGERSSQSYLRHEQTPLRRAAAIPLSQGHKLVGALWLEEPYYASQLSRVQEQVHESPVSLSENLGSAAATPGGPSATSRQPSPGAHLQPPVSALPLIRSQEALRQVSFTASMCITGIGPDSLPWLTGAVSRLLAADSMQALTTQLCMALSCYVRDRFVLDSTACAALVPPGSGSEGPQLALLIRVQPGATGEAAAGQGQGQAPGADGDTLGATDGDTSGSVLAISGSGPVGRRLGQRGIPTGGGCVTASACNTAPSVSQSLRTANIEDAFGPRSMSRFLGGITAPIPLNPASGGRVSGGRALAAISGHIVVPLSAAEIATMTSGASAPPALHASAFPLHRTLLQAVLQEQAAAGAQGQREPPAGSLRRSSPRHEGLAGRDTAGASAAKGVGGVKAAMMVTPPVSPVVEDTMLFVQNVHNPSRDICLLMCPTDPTLSGMLGVSTCAGAGAGTGGNFASNHSQASSGASSCGAQSLVLVTLLLDAGAALGLYLWFPRRLPGQLLEAVRASCQELVDLALADFVREKLHGPLAPEYCFLHSTTPGSYAVVRGLTAADEHTPQTSGRGVATESGLIGLLDTLYRRKSAMITSHISGTVFSKMFSTNMENTLEAAAGGASPNMHTRQHSLQQCGPAASEPRKVDFGSAQSFSVVRRGSASIDRGPGGGATAMARSLGDRTAPSANLSAFIAANPVAAGPTEDLLDLLLASCNADVTSANVPVPGASASMSDLRVTSASIITVTGVEAGAVAARQQMDLLVNSIHSTMQVAAAGAGGICSFASDLDQLELQEMLGRGGGGVVLKGMLSGTLPVAVKLMEMPDDEAGPSDDRPSKKQLQLQRELLRNAMELAVQSSLSHPNIVQFYSTFNNVVLRCRQSQSCARILGVDPRSLYLVPAPTGTEKVDDGAAVTCILAEYCDAGSLANALQLRVFPRLARKASPTLFMYDMKGIYMTLLDVALALRHLHSLNLVHRDVKPANLLLKSNPRDYRGFTVKLADFGFVLHLTEKAEDGSRYAIVDQACGTVTHMAPECMPGSECHMPGKARIDAAVDIYSFGIVMWELLAGGARPFPNIHPDRIPRLVYRGSRPTFAADVPHSYQHLASMCWRSNPARRPRAGELVSAIAALLSGV